MDADLGERVLPRWLRTANAARGYRLADVNPTLRTRLLRLRERLQRRRTESNGWLSRDLVSQSRLTWTFSLAHRLGYGDALHDYRRAAEHGYRFLTNHMLDRRHGGYVWRADFTGRVTDGRKALYGQAFALYALVEYHRATDREEPLARARSLFDVVQEKMADKSHSGWSEHFGADFTPLSPSDSDRSQGLLDVVGLKSANAHLHWMEALTELVRVTGGESERSALDQVVHLNMTHFFPCDPSQSQTFLSPNWHPLADSSSHQLFYGHLVEFAWLLVGAQEALGVAPAWDRVYAIVRLVLRNGFDHELGGLYWCGPRHGPATNRSKTWWVQAEALTALTMALGNRPEAEYERALRLHCRWILDHQRLDSGIWASRCERSGRFESLVANESWRAGYHEVRAMAKFVGAHGGTQSDLSSPS